MAAAQPIPRDTYRSPRACTWRTPTPSSSGRCGRAKVLRPVEDQFYGDRSGQFEDPFEHRGLTSRDDRTASCLFLAGRGAILVRHLSVVRRWP
jgi:hypothetical protein